MMANYAEISPDNIVLQVLVIDNAQEARDGEVSVGIWLKSHVHSINEWLKTSYSGKSRRRFAGPGFTYDPIKNVFLEPSPYPSWQLNNQHDWEPPINMPKDENPYLWDEDTLTWVKI